MPQTDSQHHTTLPQGSNQPTNSTALRDCTRAVSAHGTLRPRQDHASKRRTHGLYRLQIPAHRAGPGVTGADQAAGAPTGTPRPQPRRRHPKTPSTNNPNPPGTSPRNQPTELSATRTTRNSFPTSQAHRSPPNLNPKAVTLATLDYSTSEPQPKFSIPRH